MDEVCNSQCAVCTDWVTVYIVQYAICREEHVLCTGKCAVCSVQCAVCNAQYAAHSFKYVIFRG